MGDAVTCALFEAKFERIADLYADWGNIQNIVFRGPSETFKLWREERKKLFLQLDFVRWIEEPTAYAHRAGYLLIEVPLFDKKTDTLTQLEQHIDMVYAGRKRSVEKSPKASVRLIYGTLPQPKYTLYGDFNKATQGTIKKAIYVAMHQRIRKEGRPLSQADTVIAILQDPKNPFGEKWKMTASEQDAYAKGTLKKTVVYAAKMKQIKFYRDEFDALVKNTIHGRFPDFS